MKTEYLQYDIERGWKWYFQHKNYIDALVRQNKTRPYPMSGADISHPELWKAPAWQWFLETHGERVA